MSVCKHLHNAVRTDVELWKILLDRDFARKKKFGMFFLLVFFFNIIRVAMKKGYSRVSYYFIYICSQFLLDRTENTN